MELSNHSPTAWHVKTLRLCDHDPRWPAQYAVEASRIHAAIGPQIVTSEHVGSTAVPGLQSKPVLDIAIGVADEQAANACVEPLLRLGYEYRGLNGDDARRRYYTRDVAGVRVIQLHLYLLPALAWDEKILFRDALRSDATLRLAYAAEKRRVADSVNWDKSAYAEAKGPFIRAALDRLLG